MYRANVLNASRDVNASECVDELFEVSSTLCKNFFFCTISAIFYSCVCVCVWMCVLSFGQGFWSMFLTTLNCSPSTPTSFCPLGGFAKRKEQKSSPFVTNDDYSGNCAHIGKLVTNGMLAIECLKKENFGHFYRI